MKGFESRGSRADYLAREVLTAQLQVLQTGLPLTAWAVFQHKGGDWHALAVSGEVGNTDLALLAQSILDGASVNDDDTAPFEFRPANAAELDLLGAQAGTSRIFRAILTPSGGHSRGALLGWLHGGTQMPTPDTRIVMPALASMVGIMHLHAELITTERLVLETRHEDLLDPLTGTLNRTGWDQYLQQIEAALKGRDEDAMITVLDVDYLKAVNERDGRAAGDEMLRRAAQTIHAVLRRRDCVARLGADEFAILLQDIAPSEAEALSARLTAALKSVDISVSVGLAMKSEAGSLKKAFALADSSMYANKRKKHGTPAARTDAEIESHGAAV
ncbi:GGDEF domain-containing protein [Pandoraea sp.]|uniref:GGDEF domain-containing protein n=1 Tax=Pandoraea sp. TaxID=1883445 RepID=UPI00122294B0|nr:GGDEF domain-containing protein [Pandoraea sp.]TAL56791.1 MAG: GGDEF domain-containing protein [Pandoraea sp.]TAM15616.1 MAG: GGDEF domain-containing protein [Pandoraea sp.]